MSEIVEQVRVAVICTDRGQHATRRLGDAILYKYVDGTTYAAFDPKGWQDRRGGVSRQRTGVYIGKHAASHAVNLACSCGQQRRPRQDRFNDAVAALHGLGAPLDISRLPT